MAWPHRVNKRNFSQDQRDKYAESGVAMPDGSFPIKTPEDLHNAIELAGNSKNPAAARAHIRSRARVLGLENAIPPSWGTEAPQSQDTSKRDWMTKLVAKLS